MQCLICAFEWRFIDMKTKKPTHCYQETMVAILSVDNDLAPVV